MSIGFTQAELDSMKARHDELVGLYNESEDQEIYDKLTAIEFILLSTGELTYGSEPFADV